MNDSSLVKLEPGRVFWITGLSGAGKTTIGRILFKRLRAEYANIVFLDGDVMREVFGGDLGYTAEERYACAMRYAKICDMLSSQGLDVICCTISMFDAVREWNRKNIARYCEIYVKAPLETLLHRNQKGMYQSEEQKYLVGIGIKMEEPKTPDIVLKNDGNETPEQLVERILSRFEEK